MARALLPNAYISNSVIGKARSGDKPVFIRCYKREMVNTIKHIITRTKMGTTMSTHNIAILSPFQSNVNDLYDGLKDEFNEASIHSSNHGRCEYISNIHFTTFKSAKGLEFDTVIVTGLELINSLEKWRVLDWEDFYVAITRSKGKLFILGSSPISSISNYVD